jgi:hypothetical protein
MEEFRTRLLQSSGINRILEILNSKSKVHVESENITLFIGFSKKLEYINATNYLAYHLVDIVNVNRKYFEVQDMAETINLFKELKESRSIRIVIVYDCNFSDYDADRYIVPILKSMKVFLRKTEHYKDGIGLLFINGRKCMENVLKKLRRYGDINLDLANALLLHHQVWSTEEQLLSFLNASLTFQPINPRHFYAPIFHLIEATFVAYRRFLEQNYVDLLDVLFRPIMPVLKFDLPLKQSLETIISKFKKVRNISQKFRINATTNLIDISILSELRAINVPTLPKIEKKLTQFNELQHEFLQIRNGFETTMKMGAPNDFIDAYIRDIMDEMISNMTLFERHNAVLFYVNSNNFNHNIIKQTKVSLQDPPDLTNIKVMNVDKELKLMEMKVKGEILKFLYGKIKMYLEHYQQEIVDKLQEKSIGDVFELVNNWREDSEKFSSLENKYDRYNREMPSEEWYTTEDWYTSEDIFKPLNHDTWFQNLEFFIKILDDFHKHRSLLSGIYLNWVNTLFNNLKDNVTISIVNSLMVNNVPRVDRAIRNLNPVVTNVIIGRLLGEIRATDQEVDQYKRILAKQCHTKNDYHQFLRSFDGFAKILDIPLPAAEWNELLAVQAAFDNITDLANGTWIETEMTMHYWGLELLAARETLHLATSNAYMPVSFINGAAKWTTTRVANMQDVVRSDTFATSSLMDGLLVLLNFVVRWFSK